MWKNLPLDLDIRMLRVIYAILTECSITKASHTLNVSQPLISQNLKKWRILTNDQLLVRAGTVMQRTEYGDYLLESTIKILAEIDALLNTKIDFIPSTSNKKICIYISKNTGNFFILNFLDKIAEEAQFMTISIRPPMSVFNIQRELESGKIDLAIGEWTSPPASMRSEHLFNSDLMCICRKNNNFTMKSSGQFLLEEYLLQPHISTSSKINQGLCQIDNKLAQFGKKRNSIISTTDYSIIPVILKRMDLIFTTTKENGIGFIEDKDLIAITPPIELGAATIKMVWHERMQYSKYGKWLRDITANVVREQYLT